MRVSAPDRPAPDGHLRDPFARPLSRREATPYVPLMSDSDQTPQEAAPERPLSDAARRALAEAAARRAAVEAETLAPEHGGPAGPEPTRYGDWEKKGLAVDF